MRALYLLLLINLSLWFPANAQESLVPKPGEVCPELFLFQKDSSRIDLQKSDADYFLLFFWHYSCSHCHLSLNKIEKFLSEQKPEGLKVISIYPFGYDVEKFWDYVNDPENSLIDSVYIHCTDPKALTKRKLAPKSNQPPHLVLINKNLKIIANGMKAGELTNLWKEIQNKE
jgi:hypothetical protein